MYVNFEVHYEGSFFKEADVLKYKMSYVLVFREMHHSDLSIESLIERIREDAHLVYISEIYYLEPARPL